jgi:hypothetical protein
MKKATSLSRGALLRKQVRRASEFAVIESKRRRTSRQTMLQHAFQGLNARPQFQRGEQELMTQREAPLQA